MRLTGSSPIPPRIAANPLRSLDHTLARPDTAKHFSIRPHRRKRMAVLFFFISRRSSNGHKTSMSLEREIGSRVPLTVEFWFHCPAVDLVGGKLTRAFIDELRCRVSAAAKFGIGTSTAIYLDRQHTGELTPVKQGRSGGSRLDAHKDFIIGMIEEKKGYHA